MESQITTKSLSKVKAMLPTGAIGDIAIYLNISESTVSNVFAGRNKKQINEVLKRAVFLIEEDKRNKMELAQKIESL